LPAKFLADDVDCDATFPDKLLFLLNHLAPMLASDQRAIQLTAFHLLFRLAGSVLLKPAEIPVLKKGGGRRSLNY
jgi:hypothetical protein